MRVQKLNIIRYNFKVVYALTVITFYTINNNYVTKIAILDRYICFENIIR